MKSSFAWCLITALVFTVPTKVTQVDALDSTRHSAIINMALECGKKMSLQLRITNSNSGPVTLTSNCYEISRFKYLGFPIIGSMQIKAHNGAVMENVPGKVIKGWWYPNYWSSEIISPIFSVRGRPIPAEETTYQTESFPKGETVVSFDSSKIIASVRRRLVGAASARVKLIIKTTNKKIYEVISPWYKISLETRPD